MMPGRRASLHYCTTHPNERHPMNSHKTHSAILRDGLPVAIVHHSDALATMHKLHGHSVEWAVTHEGYAIVTDEVLVRGWIAFDTAASRRGYGVQGSIARLIVEIQELVKAFEGRDHAAGEWRDYVAAPHIAGMLAGVVGLLDFADSGDFAIIRGELSGWAIATAARIGADLDS